MTALEAAPAPGPPAPHRLVLDTNIVLDLLLFRDPSTGPLDQALRSGRALCVSNRPCLTELRRVLARAQFGLTSEARQQLLDDYLQLAHWTEPGCAPSASPLPRCADRDDQKFLELARDAGADFLVTKDRALLKLRRAKHGLGAFRIVTAVEWARLQG